MVKQKKSNLVWLDLEMTGLDPKTCAILEIGAIITDNNLVVLAQSPIMAIHHGPRALGSMEPWSQKHHAESGLIEACRLSKISLKQAEAEVLKLVQSYCRPKKAPLCGNTIWQDRRFLAKYMPRFEAYLHYRNIDVSSIKELVERWYPSDYRMPWKKKKKHRVLDDILESIEELKFYRNKIFVQA